MPVYFGPEGGSLLDTDIHGTLWEDVESKGIAPGIVVTLHQSYFITCYRHAVPTSLNF